ncbi:hypothetical protein [uncultured Methanobrevibacter sp.]|uniref:hypothetical protein n=1 Tax=uncultured Methanobrevibacter sp. TaxID=253161 RepID=UPI002608F59B|nr:hypothetical protein [uncultured Methanobrevibacter sp.]
MSELEEKLANLEHEQWCDWSKSVSKDIKKLIDLIDIEKLDKSDKDFVESQIRRVDNWNSYWVDYDDLDDDVKEKDRIYARKVIRIIKK